VNPLEESPVARKRAYQVFWVVSLIAGATQIGFATAKAETPTWLLVALSILPFLGAAIGYTAQANVTPAPIKAQPDQVFLVEDHPDERGAYDTGSLLIALACIVVIAVGVVWLIRSF
jgi:hypothetical protein